MSDYIHTTRSCFSDEVSSSYADEFRLMIRNIFQNFLSNEEMKTFHWYLKLPKRLLDDASPSVAILRCLEERNFIKSWREDPTGLRQDLVKAIDRYDLVSKVDELIGICLILRSTHFYSFNNVTFMHTLIFVKRNTL